MTVATHCDNPDAQYMELIRTHPVRPVFIMGDHRTGTTILYKILSTTGVFNVVTAYHIIHYNELLYNHINGIVAERKASLETLFQQKRLMDRGFDRVKASADMPEEYGFILRNGGSRPRLNPGNLNDLIELCQKIQFTSDPTRPILLKNPWDYFLNFMYVKQAFPDCKFIFIHRHPIPTVNSQLHAMRSLLAQKNEYVALVADWYRDLFRQPLKLYLARLMFTAHLDIGIRFVMRHVARGADYFLQKKPLLPDADCISVRYEDLCFQPQRTITAILDALSLDGRGDGDYGMHISVRDSALLPEVQRNRALIYNKTKPYCESFEYTL